jgi:hypothetical protein
MKLFLIPLFAFASLFSNAQTSFEGAITYSISVTSLVEGIPDAELQKNYGHHQTVFYKEGYTKVELNNGDDVWEVYISKENKQYVNFPGSKKVEVFDGTDETRTLASIKDEPSDLTVMGYRTRRLTIEYEDGSVSKYWYSSDIYIDPMQFQNLKFAFLNKYWEKAQSPYLRHERVTDVTKVVYLATNIQEKSLPNEMFDVD